MWGSRLRRRLRKAAAVVGYDIDIGRVAELEAGHDRTREVEAADLRLPCYGHDRDAALPKPIFTS